MLNSVTLRVVAPSGRYGRGEAVYPPAALADTRLQAVTIVSPYGRMRRRDANTPNLSSRHCYARGLKPTVGILPPLCPWVETHGWDPATATRFCYDYRSFRGLRFASPTAGFQSPLQGLSQEY